MLESIASPSDLFVPFKQQVENCWVRTVKLDRDLTPAQSQDDRAVAVALAQTLQPAHRTAVGIHPVEQPRDARPSDDDAVAHLVTTYAGAANEHQREMFEASLRAAFSVAEMQQLIAELGCPIGGVCLTSDRHWTWEWIKPVNAS